MQAQPPRPLRLFHFDLTTYGNYGDTLLFEAVRQTFNGFGDGNYFEVYDSRSLRDRVTPSVVDYINRTADAVIVGGGGLFLRDTSPNDVSGWQWNISMNQLVRIERPLIVFAVGNNRFIGQEDFDPIFRDHVNMVMSKSVFFGLRNSGSIDTIRNYIADVDQHRVAYQPCPTTLSSYLFPDLFEPSVQPERRLATQMIIGRRQIRAGFDVPAIYRDVCGVLKQLQDEGWQVESAPFARADTGFADQARDLGVAMTDHALYGKRNGIFGGVEYLADLPMILGTRGHAQMVPFGMGSIPLSLAVHDKIGYFATDIGHPEFVVDPRASGFADALYGVIHTAHVRRDELRLDLATTRKRLLETTLDNLATIYRDLTGTVVDDPTLTPYSPRERRLAAQTFAQRIGRTEAATKVIPVVKPAKPDSEIEAHLSWLAVRATTAARRGHFVTARHLRRAFERTNPSPEPLQSAPRWDAPPFRFVPARLIEVAARGRRKLRTRIRTT